MLKKKKKTDRPLLATAMIVLVMIVSACKDEYIYFQGHFKIDKVRMTRISIEDFPADNSVLYLMELVATEAPLDSMIYDGKLRMREIFPESKDSIEGLTFRYRGLLVYPKQIHWHPKDETNVIDVRYHPNFSSLERCDKSWKSFLCNNVDTFNAKMYLLEEKTNRIAQIEYITDYRNVPYRIKSMDTKAGVCVFDNKSDCSSRILVSFDKNGPLPDEGFIKFKNRKLYMEIDDNPKKFKLARKIYHYQSRK
ncbi:MAG: hypothetical protein K6A78_05860 [Prevotella sp.]|nr:hypothetical protein [Prevotella sp.]